MVPRYKRGPGAAHGSDAKRRRGGLLKFQRAGRLQRERPSQRRLKESQMRREHALKRAPSTVVERFQRGSKKAVCAHLLEEGFEDLFEDCGAVPLSFREVRPGEEPFFADLLLTSLPTALLAGEDSAQVKWLLALPPKVSDDLHYAPLGVQKLVTSRAYMRAISDAFQRMLGVHSAETVFSRTGSSPLRPRSRRYPALVRPCTKAQRTKFLVFDERGMEAARARTPGGAIVEEFVPHTGTVYHVFVVSLSIFVAARPSLPHVDASTSNGELEDLAARIGGSFVASEAEGRYLAFDSAVLEERCERVGTPSAAPLDEWPALKHVARELGQVASTLEQALGVGMFGFDVLLHRTGEGGFHMVDLSLMPGPAFDGADAMLAVVALHLFRECQQRAVRADIRGAVHEPRQVVGLVAAQHPGWLDVDPEGVAVEVLSAGLRGENTGLVVSLRASGKAPLVCRMRGVVERTAFEQAVADTMMGFPNTPLLGHYFGARVLIGYTEGLIAGAQLERVLDEVDRGRLCRNFGRELRNLHSRQIDVQSPDYFGIPLCVSRLRTSSIIAWEAVSRVERLQGYFDEVFDAALEYDIYRLPSEAREVVFGHFDVNLTNILVDMAAEPALAPKISFIDWEQAGPNVAAYDFGKFLVSYAIAKEPTEAALAEMLHDLVEGYAPGWGAAAKARFKVGMRAMMPYVAAVNFMSNVRHASTDTGDRWVNRGTAHYRMFAKYRHSWKAVTEACSCCSGD